MYFVFGIQANSVPRKVVALGIYNLISLVFPYL